MWPTLCWNKPSCRPKDARPLRIGRKPINQPARPSNSKLTIATNRLKRPSSVRKPANRIQTDLCKDQPKKADPLAGPAFYFLNSAVLIQSNHREHAHHQKIRGSRNNLHPNFRLNPSDNHNLLSLLLFILKHTFRRMSTDHNILGRISCCFGLIYQYKSTGFDKTRIPGILSIYHSFGTIIRKASNYRIFVSYKWQNRMFI